MYKYSLFISPRKRSTHTHAQGSEKVITVEGGRIMTADVFVLSCKKVHFLILMYCIRIINVLFSTMYKMYSFSLYHMDGITTTMCDNEIKDES